MNSTKQQRRLLIRHLLGSVFGAFASIVLGSAAFAQSTDRDQPAPLTSNEIRGTGLGKNVEYFHTFLAGPGEVVLTADVRAKAYSTYFETLLFNMDAQELGVIRYGPTMRSERRVTRIQVPQQQPVLLQIALDSSAGDYMVRVSGAVQLDSPASLSSTPAAEAAPSADTSTAPAEAAAVTETQPVAADSTASTAATGKISGFQKLWTRLSAASELLGLSKFGKLKIDMKDGTTQEIGLQKVKKVYAPKGSDPSSAQPTNESWQGLWMKLGNAGELMNLAATGSMRVELQDGTMQQFDLSKIKKVSIKK